MPITLIFLSFWKQSWRQRKKSESTSVLNFYWKINSWKGKWKIWNKNNKGKKAKYLLIENTRLSRLEALQLMRILNSRMTFITWSIFFIIFIVLKKMDKISKTRFIQAVQWQFFSLFEPRWKEGYDLKIKTTILADPDQNLFFFHLLIR